MDEPEVTRLVGAEPETAGGGGSGSVFLAAVRAWTFMGGAFGALSVMLAVTVGLGGLAAVRLAAARLLGVNPAWLVDDSYDLALVTWGLGFTGLATLVHPAAGIAALLLLRPWIDGYTFPSDNYYFAFGAQFIGLIRLLQRRREPNARFDGLLPSLLLAGFVLTGVITLPFTWQVHATARQLIIWQAALLLFVTAADVSTDRNARRVILGALAAAVFLEALFSILHFKYLLPYLRVLILENKAVLRQFFGTDQITPELARRFNYNRAFGSMLFPNALSAFLILGLPVLGAGTWRFWRGGDRPERGTSTFLQAAAAGIGAGVGAFILAMMVVHFPSTYRRPPSPWYCEVPWQIFWAFLAAAPVAGGVFTYARLYGTARALYDVARGLFPAALLTSLLALYYTFSRGGWLGLVLACATAAVLFGLPGRKPVFVGSGRTGGTVGKSKNRGKRARLLLPFLLAAGLLAFGGAERAAGQSSGGSSASARVTEEGLGVGLRELSDPSSFRLRFTYWRVGLSMFAHNALMGVGMGNFMEAYSHYQYLGAGDVREAHNGYLQAFCETGILGGTLFCGFWGLIILGSAWRLRQGVGAGAIQRRIWDVALWTGLCAFCLHAGVDINFSHPSLVMTAAAMAGVLWVGAGASGEDAAADSEHAGGDKKKKRRQPDWRLQIEGMIMGPKGRWVLIGLLTVSSLMSAWAAARVLGMELRFNGMKWLNVADSKTREKLLQVGEFFLKDVFRHAMACTEARKAGRPDPPAPKVPFVDALSLQPDITVWLPCAFYEPVPGSNQYRPLPEGALPVRQCMMGITKPWRAYQGALDGILALTARLEAIDAIWPWNPEAARYIAEWYGLLYNSVYDPDRAAARGEWRDKWLEWSRRAMERNPMNPETVRYHAKVLSGLALHDETWRDTAGRLAAMENCLELHRKTTRYAPQNAQFQFNTAWALEQLAKLYRQAGKQTEAEKMEQEAVQIRDNARRLQQLRFSLGFSY